MTTLSALAAVAFFAFLFMEFIWLVVRLSWTDVFPITSWRDFVPGSKPQKWTGR